jgi:4'-phosphopantetheinyl transferase
MHDLSLAGLQACGMVEALRLPVATCLAQTQVWSVGLEKAAVYQSECLDFLSPEEVNRTKRFLAEGPRLRYLLSHAALRIVLSECVGIAPKELRFEHTSKGKPFLASSGSCFASTHFNLSHSGDVAVIAVSRDRELGVDVEELNPRRAEQEIADRFFAEAEKRLLRALTGAEMVRKFYQFWTRKEAVLKATGLGIAAGLEQLDVSASAADLTGDGGGLRLESEGRGWRVFDLVPGAGYVGALAVCDL